MQGTKILLILLQRGAHHRMWHDPHFLFLYLIPCAVRHSAKFVYIWGRRIYSSTCEDVHNFSRSYMHTSDRKQLKFHREPRRESGFDHNVPLGTESVGTSPGWVSIALVLASSVQPLSAHFCGQEIAPSFLNPPPPPLAPELLTSLLSPADFS